MLLRIADDRYHTKIKDNALVGSTAQARKAIVGSPEAGRAIGRRLGQWMRRSSSLRWR